MDFFLLIGLGNQFKDKISTMKIFFMLLCSTAFQFAFSQQDGYWDKDRATNKQIIVSARDRILINTEELPIGTTEIVYRITLLDENQQLASSLVSVLKAIPDPTGISQGSAGTLLLLSKISGEDQCNYVLFSDQSLALAYKETGKTDKACLYQSKPVNKDAKRLTMASSACLKSNTIWFGFESKNWIMNQRIVLEVVPWVDTKLSRGWSIESRKTILKLCKATDLAKKLPNSDDYCVCILDKLQKEYKYQEFQKLLAVEKSKVFKDSGTACLVETGGSNAINSAIRTQVSELVKQEQYGPAIEKSLILVNEGKATVSDYAILGSCYLFTKQFEKAIKFLKVGEKQDDSELLIKLNLAHAYLLNNDFKAAKPIYKKYQLQNVTDSLSWVQKVEQDFEAFQKAGMTSDDFDRILRLFEN